MHRIHLTRRIEDDLQRQELVAEVQASVEETYGSQVVDREVLEKSYVEQVLLLRMVSQAKRVCVFVHKCACLFAFLCVFLFLNKCQRDERKENKGLKF